MDDTSIRYKMDATGARSLCIACGDERMIVGAWLSATELAIGAAHRCGTADVSAHDPVMSRFVAEQLTSGGVASLEEALARWEAWPGNDGLFPGASAFGRRIRRALPRGVGVDRRRIGSAGRQNWIIGLHLR